MKLIILLCFGSTFSVYMDNDQIRAVMGQVFSGNWAFRALDKDPKTFASGSISTLMWEHATVAWWHAEFNIVYTIVRVDVTNSLDPFYSPSLENFVIDIYSERRLEVFNISIVRTRCGQYASEESLQPGQSIGVVCVRPSTGKSLMIRKMTNAFNPRLIALAEVVIHHN